VRVGRYVLMPDHLHAFLCADGSSAVSRWVGSLKKFLGKHWRNSGRKGPFWQNGFFDHVLRSGESYSQKWEYVRDNPVRAGLVADVREWPYSGAVHELWW